MYRGKGGRRGVPIVAAALEHCFRHSAGGAASRRHPHCLMRVGEAQPRAAALALGSPSRASQLL